MESREFQRPSGGGLQQLCSFFFSSLSEIIGRYPILFGGEEGGDGGTFGWLSLIDRLAGGRRVEWDLILEMQLIEFLNTISFHTTITKERNKRLDQAANKGFESYVCACLNELL